MFCRTYLKVLPSVVDRLQKTPWPSPPSLHSLCNLLSLHVGRNCEFLQTNRIQQRWWYVTSVVTVPCIELHLASWLTLKTVLVGLMKEKTMLSNPCGKKLEGHLWLAPIRKLKLSVLWLQQTESYQQPCLQGSRSFPSQAPDEILSLANNFVSPLWDSGQRT